MKTALALVVLLSACATSSPPPPTATPVTNELVPDLRGTWTGTWGGTRLSLLVVDQKSGGGYSGGVYLGPLLIFGEREPGLSGVMTFTRLGEAVSVSVRGSLRGAGDTLTLGLVASPGDGQQWLMLRRVDPWHLRGTGESSFRWGPQGVVELTRGSAGNLPASGASSYAARRVIRPARIVRGGRTRSGRR